MQSVIIVMSLVGCNDAATQCERLPQPVMHWESLRQCEEEIPAKIVKPDYPIIIAKCGKKIVVAISGDPKASAKIAQTPLVQAPLVQVPVSQKQVGEPLNIIPVKGEQPAESSEDKTVVGTMMSSTKHGYIFVRKGAEKGFGKLRDGTATAYSKMRGGLGSMVSSTVKFAKRTVGATKDLITPDGRD